MEAYSQSSTLATQDQTAGTEEQDRINRFRRLAEMAGTVQPDVQQIELPPGSVSFMSGPVPVVRVVFPERAFFAFDSSTPLPSSEPILDVIADNMRHDVPDAALTVLGHTDAIGTDAYNIDLSRERAEAVIHALIDRGVDPMQLTEVAIGKRQPIAPNDTADGRALNRRVEFLVSPAMSANLAAVQQRIIPASYFAVSLADEVHPRRIAELSTHLASVANVYGAAHQPQGVAVAGADIPDFAPLGGLPLSPVTPETVTSTHPVAPAPVQLIPPSQVTPRQLGTAVTF